MGAQAAVVSAPREIVPDVSIIGAGRVGTAFARRLVQAGMSVDGPLPRGAMPAAPIVILAVPDRAIEEVARRVPAGLLVGHCAASVPLAALGPHEGFVLHPLLAITDADTSFEGGYCAVSGATDRARSAATVLGLALGLIPITIDDADRALYHAAASMASNYLVTLLWCAERLAATAGLRREALVPLIISAGVAWRDDGARAALTGPVERGDTATMERQRRAVAARHPELVDLWDALTAEAQRLVERGSE